MAGSDTVGDSDAGASEWPSVIRYRAMKKIKSSTVQPPSHHEFDGTPLNSAPLAPDDNGRVVGAIGHSPRKKRKEKTPATHRNSKDVHNTRRAAANVVRHATRRAKK